MSSHCFRTNGPDAMDPYLDSLLGRAERALRRTTIEHVVQFASTRAIVGAQAHENEYPELAIEALKRLRAGCVPSAEHLAALEGVIRAFRPAALVRHDMPDPLDDEVCAAFPSWVTFCELAASKARAVGRVDFVKKVRPLETAAIGTGFLVGQDLLVTNRHVVLQLTRGSHVLSAGQAVVRFRYEYEVTDADNASAVPVLRVVDVHSVLDLALLELGGNANVTLSLADAAPPDGTAVVTIGYPFTDPRNPVLSTTVLGDRDGVKRAAPGEVVGNNSQALFHDCSTLGGNSGSPVITMDGARVVGVHRDGYFLYRNEAVDVNSLRRFIAPHVKE